MIYLNDNKIIYLSSVPEDTMFSATRIFNEIDNSNNLFVNAVINNVSFPTKIDELEYFVYEHGMFNVEDLLAYEDNCWTMPKSSKVGDIVLFFHAKTAISRITALITEVKNLPDDTSHNRPLLLEWLERARMLYKKYGGKIFAIGRVSGAPEYYESENEGIDFHWGSHIYADIGEVQALETPIDISEFNSFIMVSRQSAITPLPAKEFNQLRKIISQKNENLPYYFKKSKIGDFKLSQINKNNYLTLTQDYRRRFILEINFRSYYVDYLLKELVGRKYYRECMCFTKGKPHYFIDNVFHYNNKYYLLEVKLNIHAEKNLFEQLQQYTDADYLLLKKDEQNKIYEFEKAFIYVIDTCSFYRYDRKQNTITELINLDDVKSADDIKRVLPK